MLDPRIEARTSVLWIALHMFFVNLLILVETPKLGLNEIAIEVAILSCKPNARGSKDVNNLLISILSPPSLVRGTPILLQSRVLTTG